MCVFFCSLSLSPLHNSRRLLSLLLFIIPSSNTFFFGTRPFFFPYHHPPLLLQKKRIIFCAWTNAPIARLPIEEKKQLKKKVAYLNKKTISCYCERKEMKNILPLIRKNIFNLIFFFFLIGFKISGI